MSWPFFSSHFCMCFFDIIVYFHTSIAIYMLMTLNFYIFLDNVLDFRPTYWIWWRPGILMHGSHHNLNMSKSELSNHPHFRPSPLLVTKWHHCVPPLTLPSSSPQQMISISFSTLVIFWMHLFTFTIDFVLIKILPSIATNLLSQILEFWCCTPNSIHHLHATIFFPENQSDLVTLPLKKPSMMTKISDERSMPCCIGIWYLGHSGCDMPFWVWVWEDSFQYFCKAL